MSNLHLFSEVMSRQLEATGRTASIFTTIGRVSPDNKRNVSHFGNRDTCKDDLGDFRSSFDLDRFGGMVEHYHLNISK